MAVRAEGKLLLRPGSILLSLSPLGLSSIFTWGWDHAALCVGHEANVVSIAEMTGRGFGLVSWNRLCDKARRVLILECDDFDAEYRVSVAEACLRIGWKQPKYDHQAEAGDDKLTCAELPIAADFEGRLDIEPLTERLTGNRTYWPQQLLDADNVSVAWDSAWKLHGKVKA